MSEFSSIMTFSFTPQSPEIRAFMDNNGKEWIVAQDICDILELADTTSACRNIDDDEKFLRKISGGRGDREAILISLSGVILLTARSNKPQAKAFNKWIRSDLIPNLFKQGYYFGGCVIARSVFCGTRMTLKTTRF